MGSPVHEDYESAFPELVALARKAAFRILRNIDDADDVAIEVMARAHVRWGRVHSYAPRWVIRVATNLAIDRARRAPSPEPDRPTPVEAVDAQVAGRSRVAEVLHRLPTRQRQVIALTVLCDLSMAEAAEILGMSLGAVKQHSHRALATLRRHHEPLPSTEHAEPRWTPTS